MAKPLSALSNGKFSIKIPHTQHQDDDFFVKSTCKLGVTAVSASDYRFMKVTVIMIQAAKITHVSAGWRQLHEI